MLTPIQEGERLAAGPFDLLCIVQESSTTFRAAILEAQDVQGFPRLDELPTIELKVGMTSPPVNLAVAQGYVKAFADCHGFEDRNIIANCVIRFRGRPTSITVANWNCGVKAITASLALRSAIPDVLVL